jgi:hypothetical protein
MQDALTWWEHAGRHPLVRLTSVLLKWTRWLPPIVDDLAWHGLCEVQRIVYLAHARGYRGRRP